MNLVSLDPEVPKINNISNRDVVDVVKEERKEEDTSKLSMPSVEGTMPSFPGKTTKCYVTTSPLLTIAIKADVVKSEYYVGVVAVSIDSESHGVDVSEKIQSASIAEYGMNGWVDPRKIANALKHPIEEIIMWLDANYYKYTRADGSTGYTQRSSEAEA